MAIHNMLQTNNYHSNSRPPTAQHAVACSPRPRLLATSLRGSFAVFRSTAAPGKLYHRHNGQPFTSLRDDPVASLPRRMSCIAAARRREMSEEALESFSGHEDFWRAESPVAGRLPDALMLTFPERFPSMSAARKACRKKLVHVVLGAGDGNEVQQGLCGSEVEVGAVICVLPKCAAATLNGAPRESTVLKVIYEDDHMAVIVKPPGYAVHGRGRKTIKHILGGSLSMSQEEHGVLPRPHPVHRLDGLTGGLLVCAKTMVAAVELSKAFAERKVQKKYHALVAGHLEGEGTLTEDVDGKEAFTIYEAVTRSRSLRFGGYITKVALWPHTGRKHQLRVHLAGIGHPIVGDGLYSDQEDPDMRLQHQGLFLWAVSLRLPHPVTGEEMEFETDLPPKFAKFSSQQHKRWEKLSSTARPLEAQQ